MNIGGQQQPVPQIVEVDKRTSSVELKQNAKGEWSIGSLKIYFDADVTTNDELMTRLSDLKFKAEQECNKKNE
jgi:hypothetical protein